MAKEIERKWMPANVPAFVFDYPHKEVVQGYMNTDPVVRIRRSGDKYYLTYKGRGYLVREEYNLPLTKEAFEHMLPKCDGIVIEKTRYKVPITKAGTLVSDEELLMDELDYDPDASYTAEVDIFHGVYEGRFYVEVEFSSEEAAETFAAPEWFGEEVTGKPGYSNAELSRAARM